MAVAPWLGRGPFDSVVEIDGFGKRPGLALTGRFAAAAAVNADAGITLRHPPFRVHRLPIHMGIGLFLERFRRRTKLVFLIGPEVEDRRIFAAVAGAKDVGLEP